MHGARQSDVFFGERESGQDARASNATAVQAVANIVKSSLGPVGLDKVLTFLLARVFLFFKRICLSLLRFGRKKSTAIIVSCSSCCCCCCSSSSRVSFVSNGIDFVRAPTDERPLFLARVVFRILPLNRCSLTISAT